MNSYFIDKYTNDILSTVNVSTNTRINNQHPNSIILNASQDIVNTNYIESFYVKPIRNAVFGNFLYYDPATSEVVYNSTTPYDITTLNNVQVLSNKTLDSTCVIQENESLKAQINDLKIQINILQEQINLLKTT